MARPRASTTVSPLDGIRTPDGRYLVVRGRLWRASNPSLAEDDRARLVAALMAARRDVAAARRSSDATAMQQARARVQGAKVALGERGPVWWSDDAHDDNRRMVHNTRYAAWFERAEMWSLLIDRLLRERAPDATICPSEVARAGMPDDWRRYLDEVREVARHLARHQRLTITQRGRTLDPDAALRGPVRLKRR